MSLILKGIDMPEKENQMYMMELYADGHCSVAKIENGEGFTSDIGYLFEGLDEIKKYCEERKNK